MDNLKVTSHGKTFAYTGGILQRLDIDAHRAVAASEQSVVTAMMVIMMMMMYTAIVLIVMLHRLQ